eukprot:2869653-Pleurochrysis_carterae.AAC.3
MLPGNLDTCWTEPVSSSPCWTAAAVLAQSSVTSTTRATVLILNHRVSSIQTTKLRVDVPPGAAHEKSGARRHSAAPHHTQLPPQPPRQKAHLDGSSVTGAPEPRVVIRCSIVELGERMR